VPLGSTGITFTGPRRPPTRSRSIRPGRSTRCSSPSPPTRASCTCSTWRSPRHHRAADSRADRHRRLLRAVAADEDGMAVRRGL